MTHFVVIRVTNQVSGLYISALTRSSISMQARHVSFRNPLQGAANELRSPDEDAPIALNLNRWLALVLLSAATKPIWSGPTATCPVTTLYNKASLNENEKQQVASEVVNLYMLATYDCN